MKQYPANDHAFFWIIPAVHQDFPDEARTPFAKLVIRAQV